eukprot:TRINITY_DN20567_c0_g3_i2.p1 TRINITY_DN20567_c0_g3~~TRINITY_DN20567_c0_g3_i2.p1  ORF type:complete len:730 (+),score=142.22 TRINITY_DN20567_c0_g3_i2:105-2294(+)
MLASAVRSLVVVDCEDEAGEGVAAQADSVLRQVRLETPAKAALAWDAASQRIVCPLAGLAGGGDVVTFVSTTNPATQYSALQQHGCSPERVPLPIGCSISDLSLAGRREDGTTWTALSCADGAVRLLDCSAGATPKVTSTLRRHGAAATAVDLSMDLQSLASGSATGQVMVQPLADCLKPDADLLTSVTDDMEVGVSSLRFSPLKTSMLAGCDLNGCLHVWDSPSMSTLCSFPEAHRGAGSDLSFSAHNQSLLMSVGQDAQLVFHDVTSGKCIRQLDVEAPLVSLSYHQDGYLVACGSSEGAALLFDLRRLVNKGVPAEPIQRYTFHKEGADAGRNVSVKALSFAPPIYPKLSRIAPTKLRGWESPTAVPASPEDVGRLAGAASMFGGRLSASGRSSADFAPTSRLLTSTPGLAQASESESGAVLQGRLPKGQQPSPQSSQFSPPAASNASSLATVGRGVAALADVLGSRRGPEGASLGDSLMSEGVGSSFTGHFGEEEKQLMRIFRMCDSTNSGVINKRDLLRVAMSTAMGARFFGFEEGVPGSKEALEASFQRLEAEDERGVTLNEFRAFCVAEVFSRRPGTDGAASLAGSLVGKAVPPRYTSGGPTPLSAEERSSKPQPGLPSSRLNSPQQALGYSRTSMDAEGDTDSAVRRTSPDSQLKGTSASGVLTEALRPLLAELRRDMSREIREAQYAVLEQNFRMHSEIRREVEELRAEVQQLRGELRVL